MAFSLNVTFETFNKTSFHEPTLRPPNERQVFIGVVGTILIIWIILFNLILITSILLNKKIRGNVFYLLVCNTSLTFLLIGALVVPFGVLSYVYGEWLFCRDLCLAYVFMEVLFYASAIIGLLMVSLERLLYAMSPTLFKGQIVLFTIALISVPWIIGLVIILPVALQPDKHNVSPNICFYEFESEFVYAVNIVTYFVPLLSILFLDALALILQLRHRRPSCVISKELSREQSNALLSIVAVIVVDLILLPLMFLYYLLLTIGAACADDPDDCPDLYLASTWRIAIVLCYIAPGFAQIGWLIDPQIRQSIMDLFCCQPCRKKKEPEHVRFATPETSCELTTATNIDDHEKRVKLFIDDSIASSEEEMSVSMEQTEQTLDTSDKNSEIERN